MPASQVIQPAQHSQVVTKRQHQQSRGQLTSFLVVDDRQTFKTTYLHIDTDKALQPYMSSLCYRQRISTQHIRTFKLLSRNIPLVQQPAASPPTNTASQQKYQQPQPILSLLRSQPTSNRSSKHCCKQFKGPFQDHPNLPKTINSCCLKKFQTRRITPPHTKKVKNVKKFKKLLDFKQGLTFVFDLVTFDPLRNFLAFPWIWLILNFKISCKFARK